MIYAFGEYIPVVDPTSFIHPQSAVTGNVIIGRNCYIGPGAALRGDWGRIIIEDGCNVQENCTIHMFPGITVLLKEGAHIGHGAIIHGAIIGKNCLVGMNSVILDNAELEDECIVGALSLIRVTDEMIAWKTEGTKLYQALPAQMHTMWKMVEPLTEIPPFGSSQDATYKPWKSDK